LSLRVASNRHCRTKQEHLCQSHDPILPVDDRTRQ
jgi:hypothetical protein